MAAARVSEETQVTAARGDGAEGCGGSWVCVGAAGGQVGSAAVGDADTLHFRRPCRHEAVVARELEMKHCSKGLSGWIKLMGRAEGERRWVARWKRVRRLPKLRILNENTLIFGLIQFKFKPNSFKQQLVILGCYSCPNNSLSKIAHY